MTGGTGINYQPSFRGALHDIDTQTQAATLDTVDPSPLIITNDNGEMEAGQDTFIEDDATPKYTTANDTNDISPPPSPSEEEEKQTSWRHPIVKSKSFFTALNGYFGWKFLSWLAIDQLFISGDVFALVMALGLPLFKELGIGASRQQLYMALIMSPWSMKPFIGVFSDLVPIGGYNKRYIAIYSILIGLLGCAILLGVYHTSDDPAQVAKEEGSDAVTYFADIVVVSFTFISFEASTLDILAEGKYSELMRINPQSGSSIISFKFMWALLGAMITTSCVGPLSDAGYFHVLFWMALALSVTPLYPTIAGWIPEKKRTVDEPGMKKLCFKSCCLFDNGTFQAKKSPFIIITLCGLCAPIVSAITTYTDLVIGLVISAALILGFVVATYIIFPRPFFKIFCAVTLFSLDWLSMASALGYYYTASEECVPGGPNFDYTFYITVSGILSSVVNFVGVILYQNFLSGWRFRSVLIFTTLIGCSASIVDVIIINRWNLAIGIPDKVFFLLGNACFESLLGIFWGVASSAIYAKAAPPGMESAVFAYTVGISNFCTMVSSLIASGAVKWSGMVTLDTGEGCNFDALPWLIVLCQMIIPLVIGMLGILLIPNKLQTEHLIEWPSEWMGEEGTVDQNDGDGLTDSTLSTTREGFESHLL